MTRSQTSAERVRRRRDKLRAAGLRPVQIWLPDTRTDQFARECGREVRLIRAAEAKAGADDEAWFEISDKSGWTA